MLFVIITAVIFAVSLASVILYHTDTKIGCFIYNHDLESFCVGFAVLFGIILFGMSCSVGAAKGLSEPTLEKNKEYVNSLHIEYEQLKEMEAYLNNEVVTPTQFLDSVTAYNEKVTECKQDIKSGQWRLHNPWLNWFTFSYWDEFDADDVEYYHLNLSK